MRLSAPTNKTFLTAFVLIVIGIALWVTAPADLSPDVAFWATTAGGVLLAIGSVFNRI